MFNWMAWPRRQRLFWSLQIAGWSTYGAVLMLPWIGKYSVLSMLPNKFAIASSGLVTSTALRFVYRTALQRQTSVNAVILLTAVASLIAGVVWDAVAAALIGAPFSDEWRALGSIEGGLPQLGGPLYHALILLAWSHAYLGIRRNAFATRTTHVDTVPVGAGEARIVARDGKRSIVLALQEIDWVKADGDFVRLHTQRKSMLIRSTMAQLESALPADAYVRIHRSSIVNIARVREVIPCANAEMVVVLRDGTKLKASRSYAHRLRAALAIRAKGAL